MHTHFSTSLNKTVLTILPGEYHATRKDIVIATVLGSCVAVALHDARQGFGGLNHFMLPAGLNVCALPVTESGKYGIHAMELLINSMLKLGSCKENMTAKVFGGGSVLHADPVFSKKIPESNIDFAFGFLETEGIRILSSDVGGSIARKILFHPRTSTVLLKRLAGGLVARVGMAEELYLEKIRRSGLDRNETTFF